MSQRHLYLADAAIMQVRTTVLAVREMPDGQAVAVQDNLHRPAGGGEPADRGEIILNDGSAFAVKQVFKIDSHTWVTISGRDHAIASGMPVVARLDADYRTHKSKLHTLIHVVLAVTVRKLPSFSVEVADISMDAGDALVVGSWSEPVSANQVAEIDAEVRSIVLQSRSVTIEKAKSLDHARERFGTLFRLSDRYQLSGRLRVVHIDQTDANPCSGTHVATTGVGPYEMIRETKDYGINQLAIRLRLTNCWMYWYGGGLNH